MKKLFRRLTRLELVLIYLVIIAGSVVRMTGSGMGCPDWPKCFGYLIPPTESSQLEWQPDRKFKEGQIIIKEESLRVAKGDFTTGQNFEESHWSFYTKHDYALFNPAHTWTEYINRLFGALSGLPMLLLVGIGLFYVRKDWRVFALSVAGLFLLGFEAWLGKLVVDGNLIPGSITIHMMGALAIVAVLLVILGLNTDFPKVGYSRGVRNFLILAAALTLFQIAIGTQVREQVDHLNHAGLGRGGWIENLDWQFYFHRSLSIVVLGLNAWLWWQNRKRSLGFKEMNPIILLILAEILLGVILNYTGMPKWAQPAHLLLAMALFGFQGYAMVRMAGAEKLAEP